MGFIREKARYSWDVKNLIPKKEREILDNKRSHKPKINIFGKKISLPQSALMRRCIGGTFLVGGVLGFLPILGFWMLPVGLVILSHDSPKIRRMRRKSDVAIVRWWRASRFSSKPSKSEKNAKKTKVAMRIT